MHHSISQMKHQLDATLCRFFLCRVTLHVSGASAHHQEYLKLVQRPLVHVLSLQVSHHISLLGPERRLRPKHVAWPCRNKTCTVLHQVGVSFDLYYDARKHKIKIYSPYICFNKDNQKFLWQQVNGSRPFLPLPPRIILSHKLFLELRKYFNTKALPFLYQTSIRNTDRQ